MASQGNLPNTSAAQGQVQNQGQGHNQGLSLSQMDLVQQLMGMNDKKNSPAGGSTATPAAAPYPPQMQMLQPQAQNNNNNIVSQLVASLQAQQAQQQSQQQAQVQAAISRAFGPSSMGGQQQQIQQPNNNNLFSQMQLAQAQGLLSGNNNLLSGLGGMGGNDVQNRMLQMKRAAMMPAQDQDVSQKKPRLDNSSLQFGNGNLLNSIQGLSNSLFPNAAGLPNMMNANPPAVGFGNTNEVDLQQKLAGARGAVIVPCRARGMPVDHNFKTAYFVIPDGIEHGDELICSFPACRQAGVKFRYCVDCKVPVAKRNFRNRHRHGVPGGDEESVSGEDEDDTGDEDETKPEGDDPTNGNICMPAEGTENQREHLIVIPDGSFKKKKKKSVRVPCRARGMPMAHNFKTAHFIIPPNIQHGDELVCSFPACRAAGAKFRYCLHCKVPVAKRNFRNRHKHGNLGDKKKASPSQEKKDVKEELEEEMMCGTNPEGKTEERRSSEEDTDHYTEDDGDLKPSASPVKDNKAEATEASNQTTVAINTNHDPTQVQQWVSLLDSKPDPNDKEAMAIWMMNLMNATDAMNSRSSETGESAVKENEEAKPQAEVKKPTEGKSEESSNEVKSEEDHDGTAQV